MDHMYEERSFFADLVEVAASERAVANSLALGDTRVSGDDPTAKPTGARARLLSLSRQDGRQAAIDHLANLADKKRGRPRADMSTASTDGGEFVPAGAPTRVAQSFAGAVRARSTVTSLLPTVPLPEFGQVLTEPRITTGPTVGLHDESSPTVSETDMVTELESTPVRTIAGQVDLSRAAFDRSDPALDMAIARELGTAYAELLEEQLINGAGTGQTLTGLLNVSDITSVSYTDGTPTVAEFWPALMETISTTATAWKNNTPAILFHLRRLAWIHSSLGNPPVPPPGVQFIATGAMPTTLGAGTNEDAVIVFDPSALQLSLSAPRFRVSLQSGSGTATARVQVIGYVAFNSARHPEAIGKLTGTGLASPSFA